jgi:AcrR family transcriptional regulator
MRRNKIQTQRKIVEAAYQLFYRQGYARVSVDAIAARAGVTKRTLYSHFRSKDDLLTAVLFRYSELQMERLQVIDERLPAEQGAMIDSLFSQLAEWAGKPRWSGSGFTRLVVELADLPGHPARSIARRAKATTEDWLIRRLTKSQVAFPKKRAREVMLLVEGAMALMLIHGDRGYAEAAALAAKQLIRKRRI